MKKIYSILTFSLILNFAMANPVITAIDNKGKWKNNSTWDLNRDPQDGDTVIIPAGITVLIDKNVNLQNATLYIKVYGKIELDGGRLRLDDNSTIILVSGATIFGHGDKKETITIGNTTKFDAQVNNIVAGPSMASSSTGSAPTGFVALGPGALPVKFIGFDVVRQNNNAVISWSTAQETNSNFFETQRSKDGNTWMTVGSVTAAGNSNDVLNYSYTDRSVTGDIVYYRIRQVDIDGRYDITFVRTLKMSGQNVQNIKISSGNSNSLYVYFATQVRSSVNVKVVSMNGRVVYQSTLSNPVGQQVLPVTNNLKGLYIVTVTNGSDVKASSQVIL